MLFFDKTPASETPWTRKFQIYDLRTIKDFTQKTNPPKREDQWLAPMASTFL